MYRSLISRIAVVVLLFAVIAKPCAGLFTNPAQAEVSLPGIELSVHAPDDQASKCKSKCLIARTEEADSGILPHKSDKPLGDGWPVAVSFSSTLKSPTSDAQPENRSIMQNMGRRLAVLGRLLL